MDPPERPPDPSHDDAAGPADDEAMVREYSQELARAIDDAIVGWVVRCVVGRVVGTGGRVDDTLTTEAERAGELCRADVSPRITRLLSTDIDAQRGSPLDILRGATRYATGVLAGRGVPTVDRDAFAVAHFPDDAYDLGPATFADVSPDLTEPGIRWGAAKAHVHLARRRAEGRR